MNSRLQDRRSTRNRWTVLGLVCLGGVVGSVQSAAAQAYNVTKSITWDITDRRGQMKKGRNTGQMQYLVRVFGDDKHGQQIVKKSKLGNQRDEKFEPELTISLVTPKIVNGELKKKILRWKSQGFDQGQEADEGQEYATLFDEERMFEIDSRHPKAKASTRIRLWEPYQDQRNRWHRKGTIRIKGEASVKAIPDEDAPETAYAEAASGGYLKLAGEVKKIEWSNGSRQGEIKVKKGEAGDGVRVSGIAQEGDSQGAIHQINHSRVSDPIHLSFTDTATGSVLGAEDVFQDLWLADGNAEVVWTLTDGLTLRADAESTAFISFDTVSDWITNPLDGAVALSDGLFEATGVFAGLPWELSEEDGYFLATVPAGEFVPDYTFAYDVSSLGSSEGDVLAEVSSDQVGYASAYDTIAPSPGTLALLGAGFLASIRRRRDGGFTPRG